MSEQNSNPSLDPERVAAAEQRCMDLVLAAEELRADAEAAMDRARSISRSWGIDLDKLIESM